MKMSRCLSASILLMLSLEAALLVAGVDDTIRLPSNTEVAAKRPWKCCDTIRCTRSFPPTCSCLDKLDRCPAGCKSCAVSTRGLFVCNDQFRGDPGPICRPWKCCDGGACTKIAPPPDCLCGDEVDKCDANCKNCVPSTTNPSRFVCKDVYRGDRAPRCRPWDCCTLATCTKSIPPICHCRDEVEECAPTCNQCAMSTSDPSRNVCNDQFRGDPGPKCTQLEDVVTAGGNYSTTGGRV